MTFLHSNVTYNKNRNKIYSTLPFIHRDVQNAVKILDIMRQAGVEPSSRSYTAILCTYAKRGNIEDIRKTLDECKAKDILLSDKEILEVVYTLAINKQFDHIDEVLNNLYRL